MCRASCTAIAFSKPCTLSASTSIFVSKASNRSSSCCWASCVALAAAADFRALLSSLALYSYASSEPATQNTMISLAMVTPLLRASSTGRGFTPTTRYPEVKVGVTEQLANMARNYLFKT